MPSDDPRAPLKLLIAAPDTLVRAGLTALLAGEPDVVIVEAANEADVVVADAAAELDGGESDLTDNPASTPLLALCEDIEQARLALQDGAMGVLSRDASGERMVAAARALASGLSVVDPAFCGELLDVPARAPTEAPESQPDATASVESLTPREHEVLSLLAEGLSNPEIAEALDISAHTAKFHVNAILDKLDARTRTEAVVRAARLGLLLL
ncbi:MAG: response regulator transcription factor [Myxococcales bacterium]|nr:response regulator transcription factor [Myxococcales bacterium]